MGVGDVTTVSQSHPDTVPGSSIRQGLSHRGMMPDQWRRSSLPDFLIGLHLSFQGPWMPQALKISTHQEVWRPNGGAEAAGSLVFSQSICI